MIAMTAKRRRQVTTFAKTLGRLFWHQEFDSDGDVVVFAYTSAAPPVADCAACDSGTCVQKVYRFAGCSEVVIAHDCRGELS